MTNQAVRDLPEGFQSSMDLSNVHVLCFGPSHSGKTIFAGTWPRPIGFLDCDGGMLSIMSNPFTAERARRNEIFWKTVPLPDDRNVQTYSEMVEALREFAVLAEQHLMRTFVIDSLTTFGEIVLRGIMVSLKKANQSPSFRDRDVQKSMMMDIFQKIFKWPCHIIVNAHETQEKDEFTGQVFTKPSTVGQYRDVLPVYFDEVVHTSVGPDEDGKPTWWVEFMPMHPGIKGAGSRLGINCNTTNSFIDVMEFYKEQ